MTAAMFDHGYQQGRSVHYVVVVVVVAIASIDIAEHYLRSLVSLFRLMMIGL